MAAQWPLVGRAEELALIAGALSDVSTRCVVLSGAAGVGKTRLAREIAELVRGERRTVRWAVATEQTRVSPLGALAPLLPDTMPDAGEIDRFRLLGWARRHLTEGRSRRDVLVIDDAPLMDDLTAALVQQLVRGDAGITLLLTARTDDLPSWLSDLARDDRVEHVWVQELAEDDLTELTEAVLGGAVDPATRALLWTHSSGNPLWLRQLVSQGTDSGTLHRHDQIWRWDGPIGGHGLRQLLADRLGRLPADQRRAFELVAVGEPLTTEVARTLGIEPQIDELAQRSLVEQDPAGGLHVAHPLYGSVTRSALSLLTIGTIERRLAEAFTRAGPLQGPDLLRVARWRLDAADTSNGELMLAAAQLAILVDPVLAERFARAACGQQPGFASMHVLGRALFDQRRSGDADEVYQQLLCTPLTPDERVGVMLETAMSRAWGEYDASAAIGLLMDAEAQEPLAAHRPLVASMRAAVELFRGSPRAALAAADNIAGDTAEDVRIRVLAALAVVPALTVTGRVGPALDLALWAREAAPPQDFSGPVSYGPTYIDAQLEWAYAFALRWAGQIDEAVSAASKALQHAAPHTARHTQSYGLLNAAAGGAWLAAGNVRNALGALRIAASVLRESDVNGTVVAVLADLARAEALAGNARAAEDLVTEASRRMTSATCLFEASLARARAVAIAMTGDLATARQEAQIGADRAREAGESVLEAACLHVLARFDGAPAAQERLAEIAETTDAELVSIFAAHADALAQSNTHDLETVVDRFAGAGARMLAAEAAASAARAYRRTGHTLDANRMSERSRRHSARCPGAPTPLLLVEPIALTARELNVVNLARRGLTNQQIADLLVVSIRTVESHLQHAYRKLGVRSRAALIDGAGPAIG